MNQNLAAAPWFERSNLDVQEFSAGGVRTFAVVEGKADAFPVIFLHGLPGGAFIWANIIKALGRSRLAIAPDLPGWGRSFTAHARKAPELSREALRSWLDGLLTAQNIKRFDLVAHGDACWPALELLIRDPSRARRLALISAPLWKRDQPGKFSRLLGGARWSRKKIARWLEENAVTHDRDLFLNALGTEDQSRTAPMLSEMEFPAHIPEYRAALKAYRGAVLLLWGQNDPLSPEAKTAELATEISGAETHRIANAGHFPTLDSPDEVASLMKEFLRD